MNRDEGEMKARAKDAISRLVAELFERISDMCFGSSEPLKMNWGWRFIYIVFGSIIFWVMFTGFGSEFSFFYNDGGLIPLILATLLYSGIMAAGIKRGGPVQLFLMGFLLLAFLLGITSQLGK